MDFAPAVKSFYKRWIDFNTRSSRSEYWWVALYQIVFLLVVGILFGIIGGIGSLGKVGSVLSAILSFIIGLPVLVLIIGHAIAGIALIVRRFHDHNFSGWFYLLYIVLMLIPLVNLIALIAMIVFLCKRGTMGLNKYGQDPLEDASVTFM